MDNKLFYGIIIIGLLIGLCVYFYPEIKSLTGNIIFKTASKATTPSSSSSTQSPLKFTTPQTPITKTTFASYAQSQPIIKDVPEGAEILLKLYTISAGEKKWETSYIVKKGSVVEGTLSNPELTLTLHSEYLADLNKIGFCVTVKKARNNGDLGIETSLGTTSLLWKYKVMMKYKECF